MGLVPRGLCVVVPAQAVKNGRIVVGLLYQGVIVGLLYCTYKGAICSCASASYKEWEDCSGLIIPRGPCIVVPVQAVKNRRISSGLIVPRGLCVVVPVQAVKNGRISRGLIVHIRSDE